MLTIIIKYWYVTFVTILLLVSLQFCTTNQKAGMKDMYKKGSIVDVRTPEEYAAGHVSGAINIPIDEVANRIDEFKELPKPIIAYCKSGNRSGMAVDILKQNGITKAINGGSIDDMLQSKK